MLRLRHPSLRSSRRRGFTTPMVAVALIVVMSGIALILDRLWLEAADLELTAAAESAALAAGRELANDDLLRLDPTPAERLQAARDAAAWVASENRVAGHPVELNSEPQGDVRLGHLILDEHEQQVRFDESDDNPTTVVVTAQRSRRANNPVGLFISGLTGIPWGDVASRVEASIDNRIVGVRPFDGTPVPALPLAIWMKDPAGKSLDTWEQQIEARRGRDDFTYESRSGQVFSGADGIPEIVLRTQGRSQSRGNSPQSQPNVLVLDIGTGLQDESLARQFASGLTTEDLADFEGELKVSPSNPEQIAAVLDLNHHDREALDNLIGEPRICLLYSEAAPQGQTRQWQATCVRLVAIRVLSIREGLDGSCELVAQPCVFATRTALLEDQSPYHTGSSNEHVANSTTANGPAVSGPAANAQQASTGTTNPYIYKLQLTH